MPASSRSIRATLQYLAAEDSGAAVYHASQAGGAAADHDGSYDLREVEIRDGRGEPFDLDNAGFMLTTHGSSVSDWHDDAMLSQIYEAEAKALVRRITGAGRIEVFDHTRRAATDGLRRNQVMREPSSVIHNDYTPWSAERRLRDILPGEAEMLLSR
ncbi:MAG: CmcJ/NvfI family oxidoreductase, partial [Pseudomonadota bacterium]|nr:CmcJ/NvfI family oxidoreductase [Pseudomonadota bacterium]